MSNGIAIFIFIKYIIVESLQVKLDLKVVLVVPLHVNILCLSSYEEFYALLRYLLGKKMLIYIDIIHSSHDYIVFFVPLIKQKKKKYKTTRLVPSSFIFPI